MPVEAIIEAPEHEVVEITGTIEFTGGHKVAFTVGHEVNSANGDQPWVGKSTDIRTAIHDALYELDFWDDGRVRCPNCGEYVDGDLQYAGMPYEMCDSCDHNARRSGWTPGDHLEQLMPQVKAVLDRYEELPTPVAKDDTDVLMHDMAGVLRKLRGTSE